MSKPIGPMRSALLACVALAAGIVTASFLFKPDAENEKIELKSGTYLPQARQIPDFSLTRDDGEPFDKSQLMGQWSVIFVGFTHCPDVCPNTLGLLKTVNKKLKAQKQNLQVVFLSVDPERDNIDALKRYVDFFDPDFVGATGENEELEKLGKGVGFVYMKTPGSSAENYNMDHSAALILVNPKAQVAGYITPPLKLDELIDDFSALIPTQS